MSHVLDIQDLNVSFAGTAVLNHFSLALKPGEVWGVVGESGSGKSVGANFAMGLLPGTAEVTCGKALLNGTSFQHNSALEWRQLRGKVISMVFQDPMTALNPSMRIGPQVLEAITAHAKASREDKSRVMKALEEVELPAEEVFAKYPHELSGGQRQRVVIAIALMNNPKLIIADEPTTALDKEVEETVLKLLVDLVKRRGSALWLVSHDMDVIKEVCDHMVVLYKGTTVEQGTAKEVFSAPKHPYTQALLACRPPKEGKPFPLPTVKDYLEGSLPKQEPLCNQVGEQPVIQIEQLRIGYKVKRKTNWVVDGLDLSVMEGESVGLVGPSGSGKSSVGRAMVGLNAFESKAFKVLGMDWDAGELPGQVQFIFQDPFSSLNPSKTVAQVLGKALRRHGVAKAERGAKSKELLEAVGLDQAALVKRPAEFSGGQRQRIGIARALAANPKMLICDESVSALDVSVQAQVLNVLNDLKQQRGLSFLFISHDPDVVRYFCDRTVHL